MTGRAGCPFSSLGPSLFLLIISPDPGGGPGRQRGRERGELERIDSFSLLAASTGSCPPRRPSDGRRACGLAAPPIRPLRSMIWPGTALHTRSWRLIIAGRRKLSRRRVMLVPVLVLVNVSGSDPVNWVGRPSDAVVAAALCEARGDRSSLGNQKAAELIMQRRSREGFRQRTGPT